MLSVEYSWLLMYFLFTNVTTILDRNNLKKENFILTNGFRVFHSTIATQFLEVGMSEKGSSCNHRPRGKTKNRELGNRHYFQWATSDGLLHSVRTHFLFFNLFFIFFCSPPFLSPLPFYSPLWCPYSQFT